MPDRQALRTTSLDIGVYGARGIPSTYGGYETFLTALLPELCQRGHRVTVYCRKGEVPNDVSVGNVERILLRTVESKQWSTLHHGLRASLAARLRRHDVVLSVNVANALFCLLARATGQRTILNTDGQEWLRGKWGGAARFFFRLSARLSGVATCALVSDSNAMRGVYLREFGLESTVIPYCATQIVTEKNPAILQQLGLRSRAYILVAGRLNPENNIDKIVKTYLSGESAARLVVLGKANYDSPVQRRLALLANKDGRLVLLGHMDDRSDFATLVGSSLAYVHGHSVGGINPVLLEAMGCGARVVAFNTEFNREALRDAGTYFSDFGKGLKEALRALESESLDEGQDFRDTARRRALEVFSLSVVADAYELLMARVAKGSWRDSHTLNTQWRHG